MKLHSYWTRNWIRILSILGISSILILIGLFLLDNSAEQQPAVEETAESQQATPEGRTQVTPHDLADSTGAPIPPLTDLAQGMTDLQPGQVELLLASYWTDLNQSGMSAEEIARMLVAYLDSGHNLPTGQPFVVGQNGRLTSAPTVRVQALDWLGEIDSRIAADYARHIFETSEVPDEWALALRNYGRVLDQSGTDDYFTSQVRALINNQDWQSNPTRGFLEAFDSAVYSAAPILIEELLEVCFTSGHKGTSLAATMALDNIAGDHPLAVARIISRPGSLIEHTPTFRASLMSRLNPLDEEHKAILRTYILDPAHGVEELDVFANSFPNHNDFASHYLLTSQSSRNLHLMARTDLAALELIREYQADPAFSDKLNLLNVMEVQLQEYVESAQRGGFLPGNE